MNGPEQEQPTKPELGTDLTTRDEVVPAVTETSATAVAAREKAAVEARFVMALRQPRNFDKARQNILAACKRPRFAAKVQYAKPIGGRKVHGLSIRFAEEAGRIWGNLYVCAIVVFDDRERRIYRVTATDLETNTTQDQDVMVEKFVERKKVKQGDEVIGSRLNSQGEKVYKKVATEDEVLVKANAAISKARRNVILTLIPSDVREEAEETALDTVHNQDARDPDRARKDILDAFHTMGVSADRVQVVIGKPLEQVNPADLNLLRQIYNALKEGEMTWADVEADEDLGRMREKQNGANGKGKGTSGLKDALKGGKPEEAPAKKKGAAKPKEEAPEPEPPSREPGEEPTEAEMRQEEKDLLAKEKAEKK